MLGGWGENLGLVLALVAAVGLVLGSRAVVMWASPRPFASAAPVGFVMVAGIFRIACLAAMAVAVMLLPPT